MAHQKSPIFRSRTTSASGPRSTTNDRHLSPSSRPSGRPAPACCLPPSKHRFTTRGSCLDVRSQPRGVARREPHRYLPQPPHRIHAVTFGSGGEGGWGRGQLVTIIIYNDHFQISRAYLDDYNLPRQTAPYFLHIMFDSLNKSNSYLIPYNLTPKSSVVFLQLYVNPQHWKYTTHSIVIEIKLKKNTQSN
jgi:hypothetical protein